MIGYITPNEHLGTSDAKSIQNAINAAVADGSLRVRIPRVNERTGEERWIIDESISLPSGIEVLVDNAHLILADGCFCNMFVAHGGRTEAQALRSITLRGHGLAILDGGHYNRLSERNSNKDGWPHISKNTTLLFSNIDGLVVEGLTLARQRWWAITNVAVRNARFSRLHFAAEHSRIDGDGVHHPNEWPRRHREMYVLNADGLDLRVGCHDILIEDISGFVGDDGVALTALGRWERESGYLPSDACPDIRDITIRRVNVESFGCAGVRLLNHNGNRLYNVLVEDLTVRHSEGIYRAHAALSVGDRNYAQTLATSGETHHVTVRRVYSTAERGVSLCGYLEDSVLSHIHATDGYPAVATREACTATLTRCRISDITCEGGAAINRDGITLDACEVED